MLVIFRCSGQIFAFFYFKMLSLYKICLYGKCGVSSRNFIKGERILNARQVVLCGTHEPNQEYWSIYSLVLQTSALSSPPHKVEGTVMKKDFTIGNFICECKAGTSECCKHVLAVLLYCNRIALDSLQVLSSTDKACLWRDLKSNALDEFKPVPVLKFHCCQRMEKEKPEPKNVCKEINGTDVLNFFVERLPNSAISKHVKGRSSDIGSLFRSVNEKIYPFKNEIVTLCQNSNFCNRVMERISCHDSGNIESCCMDFYTSNIVTLNSEFLCLDTSIEKSAWQCERQFRITGSRCYQLYTYTGGDWATKSKQYFSPKMVRTKEMRYGLQYEAVARKVYEEHLKSNVDGHIQIVECGLVVNEMNPWLGVSPDGVVFVNGKPEGIIEIKCPYEGQNLSIGDLVPRCKFMKLGDDGKFTLRDKHAYYGQVTLGMALLNVKWCDFIIFSSKDNSFFVESIELNVNFCLNFLKSLKDIYFQKMIHNVCSST